MEIPHFKMEILLFKNGDSTFKNGSYFSKWKFFFLRILISHCRIGILPIFFKVKRTCHFIQLSTVGTVKLTNIFFHVEQKF